MACVNHRSGLCRCINRSAQEQHKERMLAGGRAIVDELTGFMANCCAGRMMGLSLSLGHFRMKAMRHGTKRVHVEAGKRCGGQ